MNLSYLYIFLQSNALEIPSSIFFYKGIRPVANPIWRIILVVTLSNLVTHPTVFFGFMTSGNSYLVSTLAAEAFAIFAESVLHFIFLDQISYKHTLLNSLIANLISWQVAPLLTWLLFTFVM